MENNGRSSMRTDCSRKKASWRFPKYRRKRGRRPSNSKAVTGYLYVQIPLGLGNRRASEAERSSFPEAENPTETDARHRRRLRDIHQQGARLRHRVPHPDGDLPEAARTLYTFDSTLTLTRDNPFPALELKASRNASVTLKWMRSAGEIYKAQNIFKADAAITPKKDIILITKL